MNLKPYMIPRIFFERLGKQLDLVINGGFGTLSPTTVGGFKESQVIQL